MTGDRSGPLDARALLTRAQASGYAIEIVCLEDGDALYRGADAELAWAAATSVEGCSAIFTKAGERRSSAMLIPDLDPDEQIADFSVTADGGTFVETAMGEHG